MSTTPSRSITLIRRLVPGLFPATDGSAANKQTRISPPWLRFLAILWCSATPLSTDQFGDFEYLDTGTAITITRYIGPGSAVDITGSIIGKPVTSIGNWAFSNCWGLTRA